MASTTEDLTMTHAAARDPDQGPKHFDPLGFLNKINGLLMALAVTAWALLGNEYREKLSTLESGQTEIVRVLGDLKISVEQLKTEVSIRVQTARDEHDALRGKDADLEARLRQVEQDAVRTERPKR